MTRASLALAALLAALLPSPVAAQEAAAPPIEEVPGAIASLLDDYARAYVEHDAELLRRVVDDPIRPSELRALGHAAGVPFAHLEIEATTMFSGNLASPRIRASYPRADDVATYHVIERSRIGSETDTFEEDGAFTFIRRDGMEGYEGWRLAAKDDLEALGFFSPFHTWDEAEVTVLRSDRFIVLTHEAVARTMRDALAVAEEAYDRMASFWPGEQDETYVVVAPATREELGRILHGTIDLSKFVAFVIGGVDRTRGWEPTGPRLYVQVGHLERYGRAGQVEILAHELVHAVTREVSGPMIPAWVEEGLANLGSDHRVTRAAPVGDGDVFPSDDRFVTGPLGEIQSVYDRSQVAIETLAAEHGVEEVVDFYTELGGRRVTAGTDTFHVRDAIAKSTGWSYEAWVDAWRQRLG